MYSITQYLSCIQLHDKQISVKKLAQGMMAKDCVVEEYTTIRKEAEDICAEAKAIAAAKADAVAAE